MVRRFGGYWVAGRWVRLSGWDGMCGWVCVWLVLFCFVLGCCELCWLACWFVGNIIKPGLDLDCKLSEFTDQFSCNIARREDLTFN